MSSAAPILAGLLISRMSRTIWRLGLMLRIRMNNDELAKIVEAARGQARHNPEIAATALTEKELDQILTQEGIVDWKMVPDVYADLESARQELAKLRARILREHSAGLEQLQGEVERPSGGKEDDPEAPGSDRAAPGTRRPSRAEQRLAELRHIIDARVAQDLRVNPEWDYLRARRAKARDALQSALVERCFLPALRSAVNAKIRDQEETAARYRAPLDVAIDAGLQQREPQLVLTRAHADIQGLLQPAGNLSIGVAGPRGSGKSTLLTHFADQWPGKLHLYAPAPASYVPREFLLHLYAKICVEVVRASGKDPDTKPETETARRRRQLTALTLFTLVPAAICLSGLLLLAHAALKIGGHPGPALTGLAGGLILAGCICAVFLIAAQTSFGRRLLAPHILLRRLDMYALAGVGWLVVAGLTLLFLSDSIWGWLTIRRAAGLVSLASALAVSFAFLGSRISAGPWWKRDRQTWSRRARPIAPTAQILIDGISLSWLAVGTSAGLLFLITPTSTATVSLMLVLGATLTAGGAAAMTFGNYQLQVARDEPCGENVQRAVDDLQKVRYQRSDMSGWTGSVQASYISIGGSGSTTETEAPLGVPDIIDGIKYHLDAAGPALVCIDELDKLDSADQARAFLNEIKGVFQAPNTRFLVSMSEDAIASFERRGLPFRDVFDSAFDEVVPVPYLSLTQSRQLLNETVIGMPLPFIDLSHCLAGGLARDVIRFARRMAAHGGELADVAHRIVHEEIAGKTSAVTAGVKPIPVEPAVTSVLRALQDLDHCAVDRDSRWATTIGSGGRKRCVTSRDWLTPFVQLEASTPVGDDMQHFRSLLRMTAELAVASYYCRTLLEMFLVEEDDQLERLISAGSTTGTGSLDQLAQARQDFSINPFIAWEEVSIFRKANRMLAFGMPKQLIPASAETDPA